MGQQIRTYLDGSEARDFDLLATKLGVTRYELAKNAILKLMAEENPHQTSKGHRQQSSVDAARGGSGSGEDEGTSSQDRGRGGDDTHQRTPLSHGAQGDDQHGDDLRSLQQEQRSKPTREDASSLQPKKGDDDSQEDAEPPQEGSREDMGLFKFLVEERKTRSAPEGEQH